MFRGRRLAVGCGGFYPSVSNGLYISGKPNVTTYDGKANVGTLSTTMLCICQARYCDHDISVPE